MKSLKSLKKISVNVPRKMFHDPGCLCMPPLGSSLGHCPYKFPQRAAPISFFTQDSWKNLLFLMQPCRYRAMQSRAHR
jgi:hypothetical protein